MDDRIAENSRQRSRRAYPQGRVFAACFALVIAVVFADSRAQSQSEDEQGFKSIFDGESLDGWTGNAKLWRVDNGAIVGETKESNPIEKNEFLIWQQGELDDFILRLRFRISGTVKANSGVQVRSFYNDAGRFCGYQADIARSKNITGSIYSEGTRRGVLCPTGRCQNDTGKGIDFEEPTSFHVDDWNDLEVEARGPVILVKLNGIRSARLADSKKLCQLQGLLGFQLHVGPPMKIELRDVRLKRLPLKNMKKVVFVAGKKSHGWGNHEHYAGCKLLAKCLAESSAKQGLPVRTSVYRNGWPADPTAFDNADTIVAFCDGGGRHFLHRNGAAFDSIMRRGVGLVCLHYAVEVPKGPSGQRFLDWIGGYFETHWSVNPSWKATFKTIPEHPVTQGVEPFELHDEWYYHMRFSNRIDVTPVLSALPSEDTLTRPDGPHQNNPHVRRSVIEKKEPQHLAWAFVRRDGIGRGFGYTGAHFHNNWANNQIRRLVLNAIVWTAHGNVPKNGVRSTTPTTFDLEANQDYAKPVKEPKNR